MITKNAPLALFLLFSIAVFSQGIKENAAIVKQEIKISYLDSIKKTFTKCKTVSGVDSLWMKELSNTDLYDDLSEDIKNINIDESVDFELPTDLLKARLKTLDAKSPFNIEYNQGLENIIKSFLKNRKKSFERIMAISEYYFPMFEEALAKQNVPLEIKYLAVVESALNPKAVSRVGATGLWQFMYQTGKQYNLKIDSYVDERSDPLKASEAAAQYLANMYKAFNDWDLVLASYNSGPGNVAKAIRRSGGQQNYWNIRKNLPRETQAYVPAFLATMYLFEFHKEHGIKPDKSIIKHFATDTIMVKKQLSFQQMADLLDVPVAQLHFLNPSYKMNVVPFYENYNHFIRLPKEKIGVFASNEDKIYAYAQHELDQREKPFQPNDAIVSGDTLNSVKEKVVIQKTRHYKVRKGDSLGEIAEKFDVSVSEVKKWNKLKGDKVAFGKSLKIISSETIVRTVRKEFKSKKFQFENPSDIQKTASLDLKNTKVDSTKKLNVVEKDSSNTAKFYIVQKGDNLFSIAKANKITVEQITEWNHLLTNSVALGTSLLVSKNENEEEITEVPKFENVEYIVKKGDNLGSISKKFGTCIEDLKQWNSLTDNNVALGSTVIVAKNQPEIIKKSNTESYKKKNNLVTVSKKNVSHYSVKNGDSLYSISKKYPGVSISDIKKWNNIRDENLKPGMKLKING